MRSRPDTSASPTGTGGRWAASWATAPRIVAESLCAVADPLRTSLTAGPPASGAEVARALAHGPAILIADEPTSAVDPLNAERMVKLLCELADEFNVTLLLATHAQRLAQQFGLSLIEHRIHALDEQTHEVTIDSGVDA